MTTTTNSVWVGKRLGLSEKPIEPIHQFQIHDIIPLGNIGGAHIAFTNSALLMVATVLVVSGILLVPTAAQRLVPTRGQLIAEQLFTFVSDMVKSTAGHDAMTIGIPQFRDVGELRLDRMLAQPFRRT